MNRLTIIQFLNPSWHKQIAKFLGENPQFNKLLPIVALDEYPNGFNKNPHETDEDAPRNIFEIFIYGLAHASVDIEYGKSQYLTLVNYFREINLYTKDMNLPADIQKEKVKTYKEMINTLLDNNIIINEMKYEDLHIVEPVEGMTESTITLLHLLYDIETTDRCLPYGDKQFKRGMTMFYKLESPTKDELKNITNTWINKKVGLMFIIQYAHYSEYIL